MRNIFNKTNVPYLVAGALATLTLLASGVFAVAPYIGFLAPVAALSIGLPFIIGCAVFSVVTIALSAVVIQKNGAIRRQGALLGEEAKKNAELTLELQEKEAEISGMQKQLANQAKEIEGKDTQLTDEKSKVEAKEKEITVKDAQLVKQAEEIEGKDKIVSERDTKIEKDALKVAIADGAVQLVQGTVHGTVQLAKGAAKGTLYAYNNYIPSTESAKGALGSVGSGVKNACVARVRYVGEKFNSVVSSLYSRLYGTKVSSKEKFESRVVQRKQEEAKARIELKASSLLPDVIKLPYKISGPEEQFKREDGSKPSVQKLTRSDYLDLAVSSSEQEKQANNLDSLDLATSKNLS